MSDPISFFTSTFRTDGYVSSLSQSFQGQLSSNYSNALHDALTDPAAADWVGFLYYDLTGDMATALAIVQAVKAGQFQLEDLFSAAQAKTGPVLGGAIADPAPTLTLTGGALAGIEIDLRPMLSGLDTESWTTGAGKNGTTHHTREFYTKAGEPAGYDPGWSNPNDAPVAQDDSASGDEDGGAILGTVATNDSDVDGDILTYALVEGVDPSKGTLTFETDGSYSFTPAANFNGVVTFTYQANDGALDSNVATVTITVDPVTDLAAEDDSFTVDEDGTLSDSVATNDTTISGGTLSYALDTDVSNGTLTLNPDGSFSYEPAANYNGSDSFTYTVTDAASGESDTRTVNITVGAVNDAPVAQNDSQSISDTVNTDAGTPIAGTSNVLSNDTGSEGGALSVTGIKVASAGSFNAVTTVTAGVVIGTYGSLTMNANGTYTYTPNGAFDALTAGQIAADVFTYQLTEAGGTTATATLTINLTGVNDTSIAVNDVWLVSQGASFTAPLAWLTQNDTDPDTSVVVTSVTKTGGGAFTVNLTTGGIEIGNMSGTDSTLAYELSNGTTGTVVLHSVQTTGSGNTINLANFGDYNFAYINSEGGNDTVTGEAAPVSDGTVIGSLGFDWLLGAAGNDTLNGGGGDDWLNGGADNDQLTGATGSDKFYFSAPSSNGLDTVADVLQSSGDKIALLQGGDGWNAAGSTATSEGANLALSDYVETRDAVTNIVAGDTNKVVELQTALTTAQITGTNGGAANAYVLAFNTTTGHGELWYDSNWSNSTGRVQVASFTDIDTLAELTGLSASKVAEWTP